MSKGTQTGLDFEDAHAAFAHLTDAELKRSYQLFRLMRNPKLVSRLSHLGLRFLNWSIPGTKKAIQKTLFGQFCGGKTLTECESVIDLLWQHGVATYLDYGVEGKTSEGEYDATLQENLNAVRFANDQDQVPVVVTKTSGLASNALLEKISKGLPLNKEEESQKLRLLERLHSLARLAQSRDTSLYIDAEESWMQVAIDQLAIALMEQYNRERPVVYNTYQLYRHDKYAQLKLDIQHSLKEGYYFGAKLVRGAYMEKERKYAASKGLPSPIHADKQGVDRDFNEALMYCLDHLDTVAFCCASHNEYSNALLAQTMMDRGIDHNHPHIHFCQLYGMSNNITFNLSKSGFNAAKYVVYGPVHEVFPYLVRRAEENTSVTGEVGRELKLLHKEMQRRGL